MNVHSAHERLQVMLDQDYTAALNDLDDTCHKLMRRIADIKYHDDAESGIETIAEKTRQLNRTARAIMARMP